MKQLEQKIASLSRDQKALLQKLIGAQSEATMESSSTESVAVIGVACRFPGGAQTPSQYWEFLARGDDAISDVPKERSEWEAFRSLSRQTGEYSEIYKGGFLNNIEQFDPEFFGITPVEAQHLDPQQRLALEVAWEAFEGAGLSFEQLSGSSTGVFFGALSANCDYYVNQVNDLNEIDVYTATGGELSVIANRISYWLNLQGPSITIDTACSSSLVAVHLACQSLLSKETDYSVAGGVNVLLSPRTSVALSKLQFLSPDNHCKAFDSSANGFVRSEGAGAVVLKRLSDAQKDGDPILAVIKGSAVNQDGATNGLTAPSSHSQRAVINKAFSNAKLAPESATYFETHGTGTILGDPIEFEALSDIRKKTSHSDMCFLGAVKSNLGHLEAAAGIAGLIKVILCLQKKQIPPNIHFKALNPHIKTEGTPFVIPTTLQQWIPSGSNRIAGVSSFGFGGTNAHIVLSEAPAKRVNQPLGAHELIVLSAGDKESLIESARRLKTELQTFKDSDLSAIAYTLQHGKNSFRTRSSFTANTKSDLNEKLGSLSDDKVTEAFNGAPHIVFMFPGQGAQFINMGKDLYDKSTIYKSYVDQCLNSFQINGVSDLKEVLFPEPGNAKQAQEQLIQTKYTQCAIFTTEYSMGRFLIDLGIKPDAMIGHSIGEYAAAALSGVLTLEDAARLVANRGTLMQSQPPGAMVSVRAAYTVLANLLPKEVSIAAANAPSSCVISGDFDAIEKTLTLLDSQNISYKKLSTSHAFHSSMMDQAAEDFEKVCEQVHFSAPKTPYISTKTGTWVTFEEIRSPHFWADQIRKTVLFSKGISTILEHKNQLLIEVGPGKSSATLANFHIDDTENHVSLTTLDTPESSSENGWVNFLTAIGKMWEHGAAIAWNLLFENRIAQKIPLPTYPFRRSRYWLGNQTTSTQQPLGAVERGDQQSYSLNKIQEQLSEFITEATGKKVEPQNMNVQFVSLGLDSIFITQLSNKIKKNYGIAISFSKLTNEYSSIAKVSQHIFTNQNTAVTQNIAVPENKVPAHDSKIPSQPDLSRSFNSLEQLFSAIKILTEKVDHMSTTLEQLTLNKNSGIELQPAGTLTQSVGTKNLRFPGQLSEGQRALWFEHQMAPDGNAYNVAFAVTIENGIDKNLLYESIIELVSAHPNLRSTFSNRNGNLIRTVHSLLPPVYESHDISTLTPDGLIKLVHQKYQERFDLEKGPLLRVQLFEDNKGPTILLCTVHHIICDGWSMKVLFDQLFSTYNARKSGSSASITVPKASYDDYIKEEVTYLTSSAGKESRQYWENELKNRYDILTLNKNVSSDKIKRYHVNSVYSNIDNILLEKIDTFCKEKNITRFVLFHLAYQLVLKKISGQTNFLIATPTLNRSLSEFNFLVGYFVNPVIIRSDISDNQLTIAALHQTSTKLHEALQHQSYPYPLVVKDLSPSRTSNRPPLAQAMFNYLSKDLLGDLGETIYVDKKGASFTIGGLTLSAFPLNQEEGQFELALEFTERRDELGVVLKFNTDLIDLVKASEIIKAIAATVEILLTSTSDTASNVIQRIPHLSSCQTVVTQLSDSTGQKIDPRILGWNNTRVDYPAYKSLVELIEEQVERSPQSIALEFEKQTLTFEQLNQKANAVAHYLIDQHQCKSDTIIGVYAHRSLEMVIALVGILKAGGAYLPLDPDMPEKRLQFMAEDSGTKVILKHCSSSINLSNLSCTMKEIDSITNQKSDNPIINRSEQDLAYVIYTSGSTGNPKGVLSIHKGIINRLLWMQQEYKLSPNDTVLQKTPYSFDVSVWEFFWPLLSGAKLVIARPGGHMDPKYLHKIIRSSSITTLHFVPSMLQVFLAESELHDCTTLRQVFCSGEALPYKLQEKFFSSVAQHARLHNLYGPTEASVDVTYWECSRTDTRKLVPIGRPIANTEMHILDERLNPVAVGEVGELFIGGVGLARGYLNRPELTESRFIPNPLDKHSRSQRLYKTGDSARWLDDGSIEYLGRLDFQVKIRGVRIELGEIESALSEHSGVRECVVVASDFDGDKRLVAYIIPNETCKDTPHKDLVHQMRIFLHEKLPEAMVPSHFVTLDSFPKTVSGKVDRKKLPTPETNHSELSTSIPISNQDEKMAQIWKNILHVNDIGADDNFFDAGGHSLLIPAIISKISEIFGTTIEMVDFFQAPTIRSLSALLQQKSVSSSPQPQDDRIAKQRRALYGKTKSV